MIQYANTLKKFIDMNRDLFKMSNVVLSYSSFYKSII